jgi:microcystin degradation protein MlrC
VLIGTVADAKLVARLVTDGAKVGDAVDVDVGGLVDESAGLPVRIQGRIVGISQAPQRVKGHTWFHLGFGDGNVLVVSPYLAQIIEPSTFTSLGIDLAGFDVFAIKSRVHFRRGFDDSGFAKTILLVEPDQPFLGTVRLDGLPYQNVDLTAFYPYGNPQFPKA